MKRKATGAGCLMVFALPFAAIGLFSISLLLAAIRRGDSTRTIFFLACFAVAFCLVGFGLFFGALFTGKRLRADSTLRAQHPDAPWMWRTDWASRRINDDTPSTLVGSWAFTILWNTIAAPVLVFVPFRGNDTHPAVMLAYLFPLVGLFLLVSTIRVTLRAIRFRRSTFLADTLPAPVGGTLHGRIEVPYPALRNASHIVMRLTCTVTERHGKSSTTSILFQEEAEVVPVMLGQTADSVTIPVDIAIPADASPTDSEENGRREWRLTVDAELPGVDYSATFEVPVFRTAVSDVRAPRTLHTPVAEPRHPESCRVSHTAQGLEVFFPPFRAKFIAFTTFFFGWLLAGAVYFTLRIDVPLIFPIICGLIALLLLWTSIELFFGSTTILITPRDVTVRTKTLFWGSRRSIDRDDIASVDLSIQTQQTPGGMYPLYEVLVRPHAGPRLSAARYIRSKREAEWLASQLRRR